MIDHDKLARLQLDLEQLHSERRSLQTLYDDARQDVQDAVMRLGIHLSRAGERHWRTGDDPAVFLSLPPDVQATVREEVAQAEFIQSLKARMQALQARLSPVTADVNSMSTLVRRLEEYALVN